MTSLPFHRLELTLQLLSVGDALALNWESPEEMKRAIIYKPESLGKTLKARLL